MTTTCANEVDRNFDAFLKILPDLLQRAPGKYALLHKEKLVALFDDSISAFVEGVQKYGSDQYSVQEVTEQADSLGFYSYAGSAGKA